MSEDFVKVSKQEYAVNVIGLGYAIELLSRLTNFPSINWTAEIAVEANERCDKLSEKEIDKLIANHQADEAREGTHVAYVTEIGGIQES